MQKILVLANLAKNDGSALVNSIETYLKKRGFSVEVFGFYGKPDFNPPKDIDMAFSLGGDGTVLYAARTLADAGVPILAVNLGNFGFITEVSKDEWCNAFEQFVAGELGLSKRLMVQVHVERNGKQIAVFSGLNDAVVCAGGIAKVIHFEVSLSETELGQYRADGVIIATPTGSTAYSAAAGGPILDPAMEAMIITPICPFTLSNRPIVVKGEECICITIGEQQRSKIILTMDGQTVFPLEPHDLVHVKSYEYKAHLIQTNRRNFYEVLREKLNWSGGPDA